MPVAVFGGAAQSRRALLLVTPSGFRAEGLSVDLESEALKLSAAERARLAEVLLESLDALSEAENLHLWAEEAQRRDAALGHDPTLAHAAEDVFREARARIG
jgi:putative addiction module component (TIGR02574 family)